MDKEKDKILYISDIAVHSNPFELNIGFIRNECKFMDKEDIYKWILGDELKLKDLQHQLEEKGKVIDKILNHPFFSGDCPYSLTDDDLVKKLCDCENCQDTYKKCWLKYFENKILERGKNGNNKCFKGN